MPGFIRAIDQGTTGRAVALMHPRGRPRASVNCEFPQVYPKPGWLEQRPAGACYLAGLGVGLWDNPAQVRGTRGVQRGFAVALRHAVRRRRLDPWQQALGRVLL